MIWATEHEGPVFLRLSRMPVPELLPADYVFEPGQAVTMREGSDVTLIANGVLVVRALEAAEKLAAEGISARVLNASSMAPIDREAVVRAAKETRGNCDRGRGVYLWRAGWCGGGDTGAGASGADEDTRRAGGVCAYRARRSFCWSTSG